MSRKRSNLIYGVGINDADYVVQQNKRVLVDGKIKVVMVWTCPYYKRWGGILERGYSPRLKKLRPTYTDCTVSDNWKTFSNFRKWMVAEEERLGSLEGLQLDKDILSGVCKVYSEDTCVFVHRKINNFLIHSTKYRGKHPLGVYVHKKRPSIFVSVCNNPFSGKQCTVSRFSCPLEAHHAWKGRKHQYAIQLANSEYVTDDRVRDKLLTMYAPDTDWLEGWSLEEYNKTLVEE